MCGQDRLFLTSLTSKAGVGCRGISANVSAVHEPREVTARSPYEVPGPSQATSFTACRASTRSVRGVTPSLLYAVGRAVPIQRIGRPLMPDAALEAFLCGCQTGVKWRPETTGVSSRAHVEDWRRARGCGGAQNDYCKRLPRSDGFLNQLANLESSLSRSLLLCPSISVLARQYRRASVPTRGTRSYPPIGDVPACIQ